MRIDYSEPKQAYVSSQNKKLPRKEPVGMFTAIIIVTGVITFAIGFGTGWFFSQQSAKKAFKAATEQTSLESSPQKEINPVGKVPPAAQPVVPAQQPQPAASAPQAVPGAPVTPEPPLSFYKTLPSGQKSNVMGSGINARDDKVKQPLQAAIPSNLSKPSQPGTDAPKPAAVVPKVAQEKNSANQENSGYSVQVASYSLKSEAEAIKNKLAGKGYNVTIVESRQGDKGTWYRVRVGKKLDHEAAKELAGKLGKGAIPIPDRE